MDIFEGIGIAGSAIILLGFWRLNTHRWKDDYFIYDAVNALGSICLLAYSWRLGSIPFMVLNSAFLAIALRDCFTDTQRNARKAHYESWYDRWMR